MEVLPAMSARTALEFSQVGNRPQCVAILTRWKPQVRILHAPLGFSEIEGGLGKVVGKVFRP